MVQGNFTSLHQAFNFRNFIEILQQQVFLSSSL